MFPMFSVPQMSGGALPLYRDVLMDYDTGLPVWQAGNPVIVSGLEAVKSWAYRAALTEQARFPVFSALYGCRMGQLIGQPYESDTKRSEAARLLQEALRRSPYITSVEVLDTSFDGSTIHITANLKTIYGEEEIYV